jgi:hypothetical protein
MIYLLLCPLIDLFFLLSDPYPSYPLTYPFLTCPFSLSLYLFPSSIPSLFISSIPSPSPSPLFPYPCPSSPHPYPSYHHDDPSLPSPCSLTYASFCPYPSSCVLLMPLCPFPSCASCSMRGSDAFSSFTYDDLNRLLPTNPLLLYKLIIHFHHLLNQ